VTIETPMFPPKLHVIDGGQGLPNGTGIAPESLLGDQHGCPVSPLAIQLGEIVQEFLANDDNAKGDRLYQDMCRIIHRVSWLRCQSDLGALLQVVAAIDAFNELTDYDDLPDSHKEKVCARGRTALYAVANRLQGIVGSQADNAAFEFCGLKSST
jgi:hypothetical protein